MPKVLSSIACNLDPNLLLAALPLFEAERVEAVEWSFDALYKYPTLPGWFEELIGTFAENDRLIGHGVYFSLFAGKWSKQQDQWLRQLRSLAARYPFDHITEHFGYMTGADFHKGAPLGVPYTSTTLKLGIDRLRRIQEAGQCPVGLENLAFAYSLDEVKKHGEFLEKLVGAVNGFIILDLHNLYCQLHNFRLDFEEVIRLYPLERVREIHISGGSWEPATTDDKYPIRRDTHDDAVPEAVFALLETTLPMCPNLKYVVMEQLGTALDTDARRLAFQRDFIRMDTLVKRLNDKLPQPATNDFGPLPTGLPTTLPLEDLSLHQQQRELSHILENAKSYPEARDLLAASSLRHSAWNVEAWVPSMLETARQIAQKWKNGFE
ncbi:hypothetical protein GCM10027275_25360 [Rhabdobacter roseus]|uniref:Uncharacterized protein (UPF0276 family) n=1 Tax=Rhabdobacter roseus TaxID=1655419 RepID=A0A840TXV7_9BACT|nr:DUF692 family multinuclear iron-containing protein [Rhabdobacter roseus]MBB5284479.1 uncharacterized protein (UPF0276 family) [Rhabdobacter roseus]